MPVGLMNKVISAEIGEVMLVPEDWWIDSSLQKNFVNTGESFSLASYPELAKSFPGFRYKNNFINWDYRYKGNLTPGLCNNIAYGPNGTIVIIAQAATSGQLLVSKDHGATWEIITCGAVNAIAISYVPWLELYIVVGTTTPYTAWSVDGLVWSAGTGMTTGCATIAHNNSSTVIFGSWTTGTGYSSSNGKTWTARTQYASQCTFAAAGWNGSTFILAAGNVDSNYCSTSPDGITWTGRTGPVAKNARQLFNENGTFLYLATNYGYLASSANGISWNATAYTLPSADPKYMTKIGDIYLLVGGTTTSYLYTSTDLTNWTKQTTPSDSHTGLNVGIGTDGINCVFINKNTVTGPAIMISEPYAAKGCAASRSIMAPTGYKYVIRAR